MSLTKDFQTIGSIFDDKLEPIKKELMAHAKQQIAPLNKKFDLVIKYFDKVTTKHDIRIKRVEHELHLPPMID